MTKSNSDNLTNFTDPIHGQISVTNKELKVIETPAFQRLRKIKQLGNVHLVFPGAVHTRFSHSLGTMHIAGRYFDALFRKAEPDKDLEYLRSSVRMAGLLHDVGHGPFSHLFEKCLRKTVDGKAKLVQCVVTDLSDQLKIPEKWVREEERKKFFSHDLEHEHYSLGIIKYIFEELSYPADLAQDVCSLISNELEPSKEFTECAKRVCARHLESACVDSLIRCLHFIISGEVDVDKLDYLVRDAYFCGTKIGSIDTDFLLSAFEIKPNIGEDDEKRQCYIEIRGSAIPAFEQLLISRKQMFNRVYYHRVNLAFDRMMEKLVEQLVLKGAIEYPKDYNSFVNMTDDWLEERVSSILKDARFQDDPDTRRLAEMFLTRTMPKRVRGKEDEIVPHYRVKDRVKELKKLYREDKSDPEIVTAPLKDLTKLERDIKAKESEPPIIRIKLDTVENQAISISYVSDLLRSSLWRDVSTRVIVFESYAKSAELRELDKKVRLLPRR